MPNSLCEKQDLHYHLLMVGAHSDLLLRPERHVAMRAGEDERWKEDHNNIYTVKIVGEKLSTVAELMVFLLPASQRCASFQPPSRADGGSVGTWSLSADVLEHPSWPRTKA